MAQSLGELTRSLTTDYELARKGERTSLVGFAKCGRTLVAVKELFAKEKQPRGTYKKWVQGTCQFSERHARWYVQWFELLEEHGWDKADSLSAGGVRGAITELLAASAPKPLPVVGDTCTTADLTGLAGADFGTVYADPPWLYGNQGTRAATSNHYNGMTLDEIAALPVADTVAPNAHLHLWTTNAFLFDAHRIIEAWGFTYKSCFVWVKTQMGIGNYWRVSHEFMLLGVRGSTPFQDKSLMSWLEVRRSKHSRKPGQVRALIERASPGPYLELFAREAAQGWTVWGNEIQRTIFTQDAA